MRAAGLRILPALPLRARRFGRRPRPRRCGAGRTRTPSACRWSDAVGLLDAARPARHARARTLARQDRAEHRDHHVPKGLGGDARGRSGTRGGVARTRQRPATAIQAEPAAHLPTRVHHVAGCRAAADGTGRCADASSGAGRAPRRRDRPLGRSGDHVQVGDGPVPYGHAVRTRTGRRAAARAVGPARGHGCLRGARRDPQTGRRVAGARQEPVARSRWRCSRRARRARPGTSQHRGGPATRPTTTRLPTGQPARSGGAPQGRASPAPASRRMGAAGRRGPPPPGLRPVPGADGVRTAQRRSRRGSRGAAERQRVRVACPARDRR